MQVDVDLFDLNKQQIWQMALHLKEHAPMHRWPEKNVNKIPNSEYGRHPW